RKARIWRKFSASSKVCPSLRSEKRPVLPGAAASSISFWWATKSDSRLTSKPPSRRITASVPGCWPSPKSFRRPTGARLHETPGPLHQAQADDDHDADKHRGVGVIFGELLCLRPDLFSTFPERGSCHAGSDHRI